MSYNFSEVFDKQDSLKLGEVYDFSEVFNCKDWDEVIIVGGQRANRAIIFLKEGVAVPRIDYINRAQGELLFYFIKDEKLISPPFSLWKPGFLYFENFNNHDYISLDKKDAIFKCVILETVGSPEEILTFEKIN